MQTSEVGPLIVPCPSGLQACSTCQIPAYTNIILKELHYATLRMGTDHVYRFGRMTAIAPFIGSKNRLEDVIRWSMRPTYERSAYILQVELHPYRVSYRLYKDDL